MARSAASVGPATTPKVDIQDPNEPHKKLMGVYTEKDIHDLTAYLVTLK